MLALMLAQAEALQQAGPWSGWSAVAVLIAVLAWLAFRYLPSRDAQLKDLLLMQAAERDKDREARHKATDAFQEALGRMEVRHREESEADRELFRESLAGVCQFERRHGCGE